MPNEKTITSDETNADASAPAAAAPVAAAPAQETLDEFCTNLSNTDRRVEMIAGFHFTERVAGRTKDTPSAFAARFQSFCNKPV
jgi:hypothetical protein